MALKVSVSHYAYYMHELGLKLLGFIFFKFYLD